MDGPMRVLIVDDDPAIRELLATLLRLEGWEISLAEDGRAALEAAARTPPDVVLMDVLMPGLSGHELCRRLKDRPDPPRVIMISGLSDSADERDGRAAGADAYLRKPFSPLELLEAVSPGGGSW
jgi:DNA-binding response OmpR family regulator